MQVYLRFKTTTLNWLQHDNKHIHYRDAQSCEMRHTIEHATCLAYGERLPHTEHHFLAEAVVDGPIAAVR